MKHFKIIGFVIIFGLAAACSSTEPPQQEELTLEPVETEDSVVGVSPVVDLETLLAALESEGLELSIGENISQPFFSVDAQLFVPGDGSIQVFEYPDEAAMHAEADQVAEDGSSIGTSMPFWVATPHFYKAGRVLVLFVGEDAQVLAALEAVLGEQFAGR